LAADTHGSLADPTTELRFAEALARDARSERCRFVFISSQAASTHAPSAYGRTKAAIEAMLLPLGAVVVRPGLVYGGAAEGLYGLLLAVARHFPILPDLRPSPVVQPVHVNDLAQALAAAARMPDLAGRILSVAGPALTLTDFLHLLSRHRLKIRRAFIPVPVVLFRLLLQLASGLSSPRFAPERLDSLMALSRMHTDDDIRKLGMTLRLLPDGLAGRHWRRRGLLLEAHRLARGLLGRPATPALARRYARMLPVFGVSEALQHSDVLGSQCLGALDRPAKPSNEQDGGLRWRMTVVLRLAEADRGYTQLFLPVPGRIRAVADLALALGLEMRNRLIAPLAQRVAKRQG
jgi:NADH dehydrogenase